MNNPSSAFNEVLNYALDECDDSFISINFLELWREGEWEIIANEYPDFDLTTGQCYKEGKLL